MFKANCYCRECQYISGGNANITMGMPANGFVYTQGAPKTFQRSDLPNGVKREFCAECGTHLLSRAAGLPGAVLLKVGTLDDPSIFEKPSVAIYTIDKQPFHHVPEGVPAFERTPRR
ncbi:MAG: GFA family protein [Hyphomonadaceae bacterium]